MNLGQRPDDLPSPTQRAGYQSQWTLGPTVCTVARNDAAAVGTLRRKGVPELLFLFVIQDSGETLVDVGLQRGQLARLFVVQVQRLRDRFGQDLTRLRRRALGATVLRWWVQGLLVLGAKIATLRGRAAASELIVATLALQYRSQLGSGHTSISVGVRLCEQLNDHFRRWATASAHAARTTASRWLSEQNAWACRDDDQDGQWEDSIHDWIPL